MDVRFIYSKTQLEATVDFIAANNKSFIGRHSYIRESLLSHMIELASKYPDCYYIGTMGYLISGDVLSQEDIESDINLVMFDISVDPSLSSDNRWSDGDSIGVNITVNKNVESIKPA